MLKGYNFNKNLIIILIIFIFLFIQNCSMQNTASYYYAQKQIQHGDLNFHHHLKVNEYLNAFPQDGIKAPKDKPVNMQINTFSKNQPEKVNKNFVQIGIKTRNPKQNEKKVKLSLCFVLDISGSMSRDNKLIDTKKALNNAVSELKTGDEFTLVIFNDDAKIYIPPEIIDQNTRDSIKNQISRLEPGGGTDIESGLILGYSQVTKFTGESYKRLILLTDGKSEVDTINPKEIAEKAKVAYKPDIKISTIGLGYGVNESLLRKIAK